MRKQAWAFALIVGGLLVVAGSLYPLVAVGYLHLPSDDSWVVQHTWMVGRMEYVGCSVLDCAVTPGEDYRADGGTIAGVGIARWPARLILLTATVSLIFVVARRRTPAVIANAGLALSTLWLFLEVRALRAAMIEGFTVFPPLTDRDRLLPPVLDTWQGWTALSAGALLLCAAALLRRQRSSLSMLPPDFD